MQAVFDRRIFTYPEFLTTIDDIVAHMPELRAASRSGRVGKAFSERIMLAVTQVNGCRYCEYGHTRAALAAGVPAEDIQAIMACELDDLPQDEVVALMFGQHYAESKGQPDPDAWQRVVDTYGPEMAQDIMAYIRMITFGNLYGNTFDALLSRFTGRKAEGSSLGSELGVLFGGVLVFPAKMFWRMLRRSTPHSHA